MFDYNAEPDFEDGSTGEDKFHAWREQLTDEIISVP